MTRLLRRIGLGILALAGLYLTVVFAMVLVGFIVGFASSYRSSSRATSAATPPVTVRYVQCDAAHPSPQCIELAKRAPVATAR